MNACPRCRQSPGWVITIPGEPGEPDTRRPCDTCCRSAFDAWRDGAFMPHHKSVERADDPKALDPGENIARLLAVRDRLGV